MVKNRQHRLATHLGLSMTIFSLSFLAPPISIMNPASSCVKYNGTSLRPWLYPLLVHGQFSNSSLISVLTFSDRHKASKDLLQGYHHLPVLIKKNCSRQAYEPSPSS
ncbi:hypothetical protein EDB82DRAFT_111909 [Fusarium venenatum]|uniref:uncharacterized protein n=1 Tax=Fusarium venenatum TaxID=56646 RepID=UPI001E17D2FB|nr:hypothetical protein EDB82DRAFT_111909 [Fusarium venenatum]